MDLQRFIDTLRGFQGVPFHHQGRTVAGMDCAGLVVAALAEQGIALDVPANYAASAAGALLRQQLDACSLLRERPAHEDIQTGDVLLFRVRSNLAPQHLAVATEPGRMIHATPMMGVREVTVSEMWLHRLVAQYGWCDGH